MYDREILLTCVPEDSLEGRTQKKMQEDEGTTTNEYSSNSGNNSSSREWAQD